MRTIPKGFAIIETLIAATIMAAGLLGLLGLHSVFLKTLSDTKMQMEAVVLGEAKLQELQSYLSVSDGRILVPTNDCDTPSEQLSLYGDFYRCWQIADHDVSCPSVSNGMACPLVAQVSVSWSDRAEEEQRVALSTLINIKEPAEGARELLSFAVLAAQNQQPPDWVGSIKNE